MTRARFLVSLPLGLALVFGLCLAEAQECRKPARPPVSLDAYYAPAAGQTGDALKTALHQIITNHTRFSYMCVWTILMETDEDPANPNNVIAIYTGRSIPKTRRDQGQNDMDAWNREHVWPKSHGFPQNMQHAYTDAHHLRPEDRSVNEARNDRDFDNGGRQHGECRACRLDADSWEVPDAVKGDVARMLFYVDVRYEGSGGDATPDLKLVNTITTDTRRPELGRLCTLLRWHAQDPVSDGERRRNDGVYAWQGNRNPFIDHPEWVAAIWDATACPEEPPGPPPPSLSTAVIIGNKQSKVYHRQGCPGFNTVKQRNRVPFASAAEAEAAGYTKAGNCP